MENYIVIGGREIRKRNPTITAQYIPKTPKHLCKNLFNKLTAATNPHPTLT
jgi:hypothetical protein